MRKWITATIASLLAIGFMVATPVQAVAQDPSDRNVSLDVDEADVRAVLESLFKDVGVSYSIDPQITGTVTLSVREQPFRTVLETVLRQANATYRVQGGTYFVVPKQEISITPNQSPDFVAPAAKNRLQRIKIMHADPQFIFMMLRGNAQFGRAPEMTALAVGGGGGGAGGGVGGGVGGAGGTGGGGTGGGGTGGRQGGGL